jgi:hypothetical protein
MISAHFLALFSLVFMKELHFETYLLMVFISINVLVILVNSTRVVHPLTRKIGSGIVEGLTEVARCLAGKKDRKKKLRRRLARSEIALKLKLSKCLEPNLTHCKSPLFPKTIVLTHYLTNSKKNYTGERAKSGTNRSKRLALYERKMAKKSKCGKQVVQTREVNSENVEEKCDKVYALSEPQKSCVQIINKDVKLGHCRPRRLMFGTALRGGLTATKGGMAPKSRPQASYV